MQSKPCNIALIPSAELSAQATKLSRTLSSGDTYFSLSEGKVYPHVSLYMLELKIADYKKVSDILQSIASTYSAFNLVATKYEQKMRFLDVEYSPTVELRAFQEIIINRLNPLRNGLREKDNQRLLDAKGIKREYYEKFGYPNLKQLFRPHLTLTRFKSEDLYDAMTLPDPDTFSGTFERLGFFESGDNGTCVRLVEDFILD